MSLMTKQTIALLAVLLSFLTGCMVGPDFHSPKAPQTTRYTETALPKKTVSTQGIGNGGKSQHYMMGKNIPAEWWRLFHSKEINALIEQGIQNSPNLAAAEAALRVAQETLNAQIGTSLYPQVNLKLGAQRTRTSAASITGNTAANIFDLYNASIPVSYTLDTFGGLRREIQSLRDQVDYQQFQLEAAYLSLTANIVTTAVTAASLQAQIDATYQIIKIQSDQLKIIQGQFNIGGVSRANVLSQQAELAQTTASLPPLKQQLAQAHHALAVLVGVLPSEIRIPKIDLDKLYLPAQIPVSLPSELVRQRPDIRASEALLAAASEQIGVATANLLPQITLSGTLGWLNTSPSNLFAEHNQIWNFGGSLLQPIFNGGALQATRRGAIDSYQQAAAQYRQTVLQAFQNVADALRALQHDAEALRSQRDAEVASRRSMMLTTEQFRLGGVNYVTLLTANQQYQLARLSRIQAQATRYNDTAALFQALGGGWWNRQSDLNKQTSHQACCVAASQDPKEKTWTSKPKSA